MPDEQVSTPDMPVSYTHLDVYKRQAYIGFLSEEATVDEQSFPMVKELLSYTPVSYTHLYDMDISATRS